MNSWRIVPSALKGTLQIPSSKSQSIRALLFALLASGKSIIKNLLPSPDVEAMMTACQHLGAIIDQYEDHLQICGVAGKIHGAEDVIQAGNSGLIFRFIGAISALSSLPIVITGDHSIRHVRPIAPLLEALNQLGAEAHSTRGDGAPIIVRGPIYPGVAILNGEDSQPVSALLIACAFSKGPFEIFVTNPGEKPWVNLTLNWFSRFGIPYSASHFDHYKIEGNASIKGFEYTVHADFSSLSYPLVAAILTGSKIRFDNLDFNDPQGDKKILSHLQNMGAEIAIDGKALLVNRCSSLKGITIDVNDCIDAIPLLAVVGCFAEGKTELKGAAIARKKECDRLSCIVQELRKMGAHIEEHPDGLTVYRSSLKGAELNSHEDHRIALSLAIGALASKGETLINNTSCTSKSYPHFLKQMQTLGAHIISKKGPSRSLSQGLSQGPSRLKQKY